MRDKFPTVGVQLLTQRALDGRVPFTFLVEIVAFSEGTVTVTVDLVFFPEIVEIGEEIVGQVALAVAVLDQDLGEDRNGLSSALIAFGRVNMFNLENVFIGVLCRETHFHLL